MHNGSAAFCVITICVCIVVGSYLAGKNKGTKIKEAEIVEKGFGEYKPMPDGNIEFRWKIKEEPMKNN